MLIGTAEEHRIKYRIRGQSSGASDVLFGKYPACGSAYLLMPPPCPFDLNLAFPHAAPCLACIAHKSLGKASFKPGLRSHRILKNSFPEGRYLTFANFVNFCSNFLCFLLYLHSPCPSWPSVFCFPRDWGAWNRQGSTSTTQKIAKVTKRFVQTGWRPANLHSLRPLRCYT
jgi:hypothetical protein